MRTKNLINIEQNLIINHPCGLNVGLDSIMYVVLSNTIDVLVIYCMRSVDSFRKVEVVLIITCGWVELISVYDVQCIYKYLRMTMMHR